jgi:DnaJ homolog subfamily C member 28
MNDDFEQPIDKIIREAREKGAFQDLPGKGQPLRWQDDALVPDDQRMAHKLLRDNGFTLDWIAFGQEIEAQHAALVGRLESQRAARASGGLDEAGWQQARADFTAAVRALNRRIIEYNVRVPNEAFSRPPYPTDPDAGSAQAGGGQPK